ncbi:MAG: condensation domain-containing protein, partial [Acidobacteriota bacterium]
ADSSTAPRQAVETVSVRLDGPATETLVRQVPAAGHLRTHEILVAALASTLAERVGDRQVNFFLERHGREALQPGLDATQVVGWLTSLFPVRLDLPGEPGALLRVTKDHLRQVPRGGIGYGWLRYASSDHAVRRELATLEARAPHPVVFNYLGEAEGLVPSDGPFRLAKPLALSRGPKAHCPFALEVVARLQGGRLEVDWIFDRQTFRRGTVQRLASAFLQHLHDLLEHCLADRQSGRSASDFPLANLDEAKLGKLAAVLRRGQT